MSFSSPGGTPSAWGTRSCTLMPSTTTPRLRYRRHVASSAEASARHGLHHDAQKLITTTLPRSEARSMAPSPPSRGRTNRGASGVNPRASATEIDAGRLLRAVMKASRPNTETRLTSRTTCLLMMLTLFQQDGATSQGDRLGLLSWRRGPDFVDVPLRPALILRPQRLDIRLLYGTIISILRSSTLSPSGPRNGPINFERMTPALSMKYVVGRPKS